MPKTPRKDLLMKMPWEEEGVIFDAEKAKSLVLNLRADKEKLQSQLTEMKTLNDSLTSERDEAQAKVGELETVRKELQNTTHELTSLQTLRAKEALLADNGVPLTMATYIPDGSEEEMAKAVADFLAFRGETASSTNNDAPPAPVIPQDPAQSAEDLADDRQAWADAIFGDTDQ